MSLTNSSNFLFSGSALTLGASLEEPINEHLTDVPSAVLSPSGGYASQSRSGLNFRDLITTGRAYASVVGRKLSDGTYSTLVTAIVEDVDILGVVKVDALVSRIASNYVIPVPGAPEPPDPDRQPSVFYLDGSAVHGLKINGTSYAVNIPQGALRINKTDTKCDRVCSVRADGVDLAYNRALRFQEFGSIRLAQLDNYFGKLTFTMLSIDLGCAVSGKVVGSSTASNGHPPPPNAGGF